MLLSTLFGLASIMAASATPLYALSARDTVDESRQAALDAWLVDTNDTATLIIGSHFYTKAAPVSKLNKRDCNLRRWTNNNVDPAGQFWSDWTQASGCFWNRDNSASATCTIMTSQTVTRTVLVGFDFSIGSPEKIAEIINSNAALNLGVLWSTSKTTSASTRCNVNPHDVVRVYQRNRVGWADTAQRRCLQGCGVGTQCTNWEFANLHCILNKDDPLSWKRGCSRGANAHCS